MASRAGGADRHLLDVGGGIGGTARFAAHTYGCRVTSIDLTDDYVETARALTALAGLGDQVAFEQASALELPFPDATFDAVCVLHVGMNIEDKSTLCAELRRVIRTGGRCGVYDVMRTGEGELAYPVPWAGSPATSFIADLATYRERLVTAGFDIDATRTAVTSPSTFSIASRPRARRPLIRNSDSTCSWAPQPHKRCPMCSPHSNATSSLRSRSSPTPADPVPRPARIRTLPART